MEGHLSEPLPEQLGLRGRSTISWAFCAPQLQMPALSSEPARGAAQPSATEKRDLRVSRQMRSLGDGTWRLYREDRNHFVRTTGFRVIFENKGASVPLAVTA